MQAMGATSIRKADQQQHIEALEVLQQCLTEVCQDQPDMLASLVVFLYHPSISYRMGTDGVSEDLNTMHANLHSCHTLCISR